MVQTEMPAVLVLVLLGLLLGVRGDIASGIESNFLLSKNSLLSLHFILGVALRGPKKEKNLQENLANRISLRANT